MSVCLPWRFFVVPENGRDRRYVNEIAPRVHNSGHWTMDGGADVQFENHMRAVAGWPLGSTQLKAPEAEMINLIGDDILDWQQDRGGARGVSASLWQEEARPGRKMGHVNRLLAKTPR